MWYLKVKLKHSDCIYAPKLEELGLNVFFYYIGHYIKGRYVYTSAIQRIVGSENKVRKYIGYMKNHEQISKIEVYGNTIFTLARHKKELKTYSTVYNPILIYPAPSYLSKDGFEIIEVACWNRKPLEDFIKAFQKAKTTIHFEILKFENKSMDDIYVSKLLPKLPEKQKQAILLAFKHGYYLFPKMTNLDKLAKLAKVSKPTFRENLRKAEVKLIPQLISE
jgi:predicted DNA binding protein